MLDALLDMGILKVTKIISEQEIIGSGRLNLQCLFQEIPSWGYIVMDILSVC